MLKKLAKYGNSTTLVIDKAILELLNMNESSIVKLKTDGKSLIITPAPTLDESEKVSYSGIEAMAVAGMTVKEKGLEQINNLSEDGKQLTQKLQEKFQHIFKKHQKTLTKFNDHKTLLGQVYIDAVENITNKLDPEKDSEPFLLETAALNEKFFPELADFNKEMKAVSLKFKEEMDQQQQKDTQNK